MADDRIIADVSKHLLEKIRRAVSPALLKAPEQVALCAPGQQNTEAVVGIYLYSMRDFSVHVPEAVPGQPPPLALSLAYVLFLHAGGQAPAEPLLGAQLFGRIFQTLQQSPRIDVAAIHAGAGAADKPAAWSFQKLDDNQKQQLWLGFGQPLCASVFVEAGPFVLGSQSRAAPVTAYTGEVKRK